MKSQNVSRSVLFADISDSTQIYENLGDERGRSLVLECVALMKQVVESNRGVVIDRIGDELLCTFDDAATAGRTSCELHRAIEEADASAPVKLRIRIGFHHGPIVVDEDHIFGDTVHIAKRVSSLAKAQQTLTTRQAKDLIAPAEQLVMRFVDRTQLKGKVGSFELFEIVWDVTAATTKVTGTGPMTPGLEDTQELLLQAGAQSYTIDSAHPRLSIGRDPRADIFVDHSKVSRLHGRIECRKDAFFFIDQSTNGSQVVEKDGEPRSLRRDECQLGEEGTILLGPKSSKLRLPSLGYRLVRRPRGA